MQAYLPTILAVIVGMIPTLSADAAAAIGVFVQHNPTISAWAVAVLWAVYHFMPSPIQGQITGSTPPKV